MADGDYVKYQDVRDINKLDISDVDNDVLDKQILRAKREVEGILKTSIHPTDQPSFTDAEFNSRDLSDGNFGSLLYFTDFEDYGKIAAISAVSYKTVDTDSYTVQTEGQNNDYVVDERIGAIKFSFYMVRDGSDNIKVSGTYGYITANLPDWVSEWIQLAAALQGVVYASGGSYEDVSNYTIGNISNSKGQYATNLKGQHNLIKGMLDNHLEVHGIKRKRISSTLC